MNRTNFLSFKNSVQVFVFVLLVTDNLGAGECRKCLERGDDICPPGIILTADCDWEGGAICNGFGNCPFPDGVRPIFKDGECGDSDLKSDKCELEQIDIATAFCAVTCKIVPFIRCDCERTGGRSGFGFIGPAFKDCVVR